MLMRIIKASNAIGYCSHLALSIVVSSKGCSLGSLFKYCSSFSTLYTLAGERFHSFLFFECEIVRSRGCT
jgi:hypothetical protein